MSASELYYVISKVYFYGAAQAPGLYEALNAYGLKVAQMRHNFDARLGVLRSIYPLGSSVQAHDLKAPECNPLVAGYIYDICADRFLLRVSYKDEDGTLQYSNYNLHMSEKDGAEELRFNTFYVHPELGMVEITE